VSTDLVDLLEDVEHVILAVDGPAAGTAVAQPGAANVLSAAERSERVVSVVGDGSGEAEPLIKALTTYASQHGGGIDQARRITVFVGDSITGVQAAGAAGVACIAFVDEPGDRRRFEESGAAAVISDMDELVRALNARWDAQWCARQGCC
jgi:phosphoglycolate phosphatase-like HAD superfamily hydrolase